MKNEPMHNLLETYEFIKESIENNEHNDVVLKLRDILSLDRSWAAYYKIDGSSDNIGITFVKNGNEIILNILSTPGNGVSFVITFNGEEIAKKIKDNDVENILNIIDSDTDFISALEILKNKMGNVDTDKDTTPTESPTEAPADDVTPENRTKILDIFNKRA